MLNADADWAEKTMQKILITGATGFVGSALTQHLHQQGHSLTAAVRRVTDSLPPSIQQIPIGDLF